jgi:hypothetical protein
MKIDINKKYRYRNGTAARILCVDAPTKAEPVISMDEDGLIRRHKPDGEYYNDGTSSLDLIEVREPREFNLQVATSLNTCYPVGYFSSADDAGRVSSCTFWEVIRVREIID